MISINLYHRPSPNSVNNSLIRGVPGEDSTENSVDNQACMITAPNVVVSPSVNAS